MSAADLLIEVSAAGMRLELTDGGGLVVKPSRLATPDILSKLRAVKPELIEHLRARREALRRQLSARAISTLTDQQRRSAALEPAGDGTYVAAVAVRMAAGGVAVALMTGIRGDGTQLLIAFERSCELPPQ